MWLSKLKRFSQSLKFYESFMKHVFQFFFEINFPSEFLYIIIYINKFRIIDF